MSLLWKSAVEAIRSSDPDEQDEDPVGYSKDHAKHSPSPWLAKAGIGSSPCTSPGCPQFDQEHSDAFDRAESAFENGKGEFKMAGMNHKINGMESRINQDTVEAYRDNPPQKKELPKTFSHRGQEHIMDGHHRFVGDRLARRSTPRLHVDLED